MMGFRGSDRDRLTFVPIFEQEFTYPLGSSFLDKRPPSGSYFGFARVA